MLALKQKSISLLAALVLTTRLAAPMTLADASAPGQTWQAPAALALSSDGRQLFAACARAHRLLVLDSETLALTASIGLPDMPTGLALSTNGRTLYVTCAAPAGSLVVLDIPQRKILRRIPAGHTPMAPVLSCDENTIYVCNRFNNDLSVINLVSGKETTRIAVDREPVAAALTPNGKLLVVANHLHSGRADAERVAARVSVIDTAAGKVLKHLQLPNGSGLLNNVAISPDGRYACVTHVLARFQLPTTQVERGWINSNAFTLIELDTLSILNTVLLDNAESGAANPWSCGWSPDGTTLFVTHAGTHEVSLIGFRGLLARLARLPENLEDRLTADYATASRVKADVPNDLAFLTGLRERIKLNGKGPRAAVVKGTRLIVASFFSDTLEVVDLQRSPTPILLQALLTADLPMSEIRRGEFFFNDGSLCFQGWQSCASCHSDDARVDGLNWDLMNDGIGNPKNTKSMLLAHRTPPAMSLGVRDTAETAVRAGLRSILFTVQPEAVPRAIDAYLKNLTPIPSPIVVSNRFTARIKAGETIFNSPQTGCSSCHPHGLYTNMQHYDVGTQNQTDKPGEAYDTPTLVEIWRTAPYLHDGSAATLREVLVDHNPSDRHGRTSHLTPNQLEALIAYLLSL
jgi:YVTN family beta-propeller protein